MAAFSSFDRLHSNKIHKIQDCPQKHLHSPHIDDTLEAEAGGVLTDQETYPTCNAEASKGEPRRRIESTKKANKQMRGKSENIGVNPFKKMVVSWQES